MTDYDALIDAAADAVLRTYKVKGAAARADCERDAAAALSKAASLRSGRDDGSAYAADVEAAQQDMRNRVADKLSQSIAKKSWAIAVSNSVDTITRTIRKIIHGE
jgi:hypothetical protein